MQITQSALRRGQALTEAMPAAQRMAQQTQAGPHAISEEEKTFAMRVSCSNPLEHTLPKYLHY